MQYKIELDIDLAECYYGIEKVNIKDNCNRK